jgi:hypothetical protein
MNDIYDERDMLDACGHDGPWEVVFVCARGRHSRSFRTAMVKCGECGRTYFVIIPAAE